MACLRTRYYDFQLKLKYKCYINNVNFKLVNEYYTSKTCSICGNYNENSLICYEGEFKNGQYHGSGRYYNENGKITNGIFKNGKITKG